MCLRWFGCSSSCIYVHVSVFVLACVHVCIMSSLQENPALRYKTGIRRSTDRWPTEYKLQYGWKAPDTSAPLLQAQEALDHHHHHCDDHHPACPKKPVSQDNQDDQDSQDDLGDSVRSVDGSYDSDQEGHVPVVTEPTSKRTTTATKKQRQTSKQKTATHQASKQPVRVPTLNLTKTKRTAPIKTRNRPMIPATLEEEQEARSESDTDSQTGQKPQKSSTSTHYKCGHKKKRKTKRKLIWPMTTEYQTQFKLREKPSVVDDEKDQVTISSILS